MKLKFATVDVFTDRQFGGNPLAVVLNGQGLSSEQMQSIAAEFNLAETTFVLPPQDEANTAQVRIFTPRHEMPFAGHPNVGTAFVLARNGKIHGQPIGAGPLRFEEQAGLVEMTLINGDHQIAGARLASPQPLEMGEEVPADVVAAACSLPVQDIEMARHAPRLASCGARFVVAELRNRAALAAASPRPDVFASNLPVETTTGIHLYCRDESAEVEIQTRMFAPLHGIPEDPATGSANVALAGLLAALDSREKLELAINVAQGVDMGRASLMAVEARKDRAGIVSTWIGGACVPVMTGEIDLL